jgi:signal transduction histidine kinase
MIISGNEIERLSQNIRKIIDGQSIDLRDNREGKFSILKNDIHILADRLTEQADTLRRERDAMSRALADISHQLKTPLTSAMIMADLLPDAPPDKQREFAANIKTALSRTEWLVTSLLKMAKLEAGTVVFSPEAVSAGELIKLALEPLKILLDVKNQRLSIKDGAYLNCDKRWTAEAITNIVKNASEHTPVGGLIRIASDDNPICAWLSVTDSGPGIPIAAISSLFIRFEGSHSTHGYGIGLPLALAIIRGQNGDIEVDGGGNGIGSTFTIKLFK